jgi:acyl-CoA thioester hydrolase
MAKATYIQPSPKEWVEKFTFKIPINIRYSETDMSGHLNNVTHLIYFEQGRVDYFDALSIGDEVLHADAELMIVAADVACHYLEQVFFRDKLQLGVRIAHLGNSSMEFEYCLLNEDTERLVAAGRGTIVLVGKSTGRSAPIPESVKKAIMAFEKMEVVK